MGKRNRCRIIPRRCGLRIFFSIWRGKSPPELRLLPPFLPYRSQGFSDSLKSCFCLIQSAARSLRYPLVKNVHPCTFLTASFLQGKKLVPVWNNRHPCRISHTVRNIEHCIYRHGWRLFYAVAMFWHSHNIAGKTIHGCIVLTNALRRGC